MKYKVGDKVRVRNDLVEYRSYGGYVFVPTMSKFKGEQIIKKFVKMDIQSLQIHEILHGQTKCLRILRRIK